MSLSNGQNLIIRVPFYNPPSEYDTNKFANKVSPICSRNYWGIISVQQTNYWSYILH